MAWDIALRAVILCILSISLGSSCERRQVVAREPILEHCPDARELSLIQVFLDGSQSMQGFVSLGTSTQYALTVDGLDGILHRVWPDASIQFNCFGSRVLPLAGRAHRDAMLKEFYADTTYCRKTLIELALDSARTGSLAIVLTDLHEDKGDVSVISGRIYNKFIRSGESVLLIGMRSEFSGEVSEVGVENLKFEYQSDPGNAATYRPYYLLVVGTHKDVLRFKDAFVSVSGIPPTFPQYALYSRFLVEAPRTIAEGAVATSDGMRRLDDLERHPQFEILKTPSSMRIKGKCSLLGEVCHFSPSGLQGAVLIRDAVDTLRSSLNARCFEIAGLDLQGDSLTVEFRFTSASECMTPGATYQCNIEVALNPASYSNPPWVAEWDMGALPGNVSGDLDLGNRTVALKRFSEELLEYAVGSGSQPLAQYVFFVRPRE